MATSVQSESTLERGLMETLEQMNYQRVVISDLQALETNFRQQLAKHNNTEFTEAEFKRILIHLEGGSTFEKAKKLRDRYELLREDGTIKYIEFLNKKDWCKNEFQVANQITDLGKVHSRYDVTILVNGLPLVQIELKRRGIEIKEAYNQVQRYHKSAFTGLFSYIQIFVISNGVHTRYFANNPNGGFKFTFQWSDKANVHTDRLEHFAHHFLERCVLGKILAKYIVLHESDKLLMVLRPYQYYAVEEILSQVENTNHNGYIWHTTGSGKTLTSFKAAELIAELLDIDKVLFVVDRHDLDAQTKKEYNAFSPDCVKDIENTHTLVKELTSTVNKRIITTIQKLNKAVCTERHRKELEGVKDKNIILIFDECHRSQFGDMHRNITNFFSQVRYFGFTGTPIFSQNANDKRTTADIFGKRLHTYMIKDAIADENVLGFLVEYYGSWHRTTDDKTEVKSIDTRELLEAPERIKQNAQFIIDNYNTSTYSRDFNAMLATGGIPMLLKYYEAFKSLKHNLKIATIFTYGANPDTEDDQTGTGEGFIDEETTRDKMQRIMEEYNELFSTNFSIDTFAEYYDDIAERVRSRQIDLLIVSDMFLTGFDAKKLNTLYVDKNLKHHGLIQAFSRTNRVLNEKKKFGKIVCFRNLAERVDEAILMYSDNNALEYVKMKPYKELLSEFEEQTIALLQRFDHVYSISDFIDEQEKHLFAVMFRRLLRLLNQMQAYNEHQEDKLPLTPQQIADYKSIYLDLAQCITPTGPTDEVPVSVIEDVDFELELLRRDLINVHYIIELLKTLQPKDENYPERRKAILEIVEQDPVLRPKRDLIDEFIALSIDHSESFDAAQVGEELDAFFIRKRTEAVHCLAEEESVSSELLDTFVSKYDYLDVLQDELITQAVSQLKIKFMERREKKNRILSRLKDIIALFGLK
ncbi:restriction endonuclease subunit R [Porphyromonas macacae]|uniref:Type I restriction enzyme endonuclease subunit n=1 Tax=Porphyromonas macacae TaxID=28115 RepID=A0A0A2E7P8_9PORP|nr:type I restriction endonuclease subunit R [Porphyromonas macacae]KGN72484.1 restriction endonuclease subunit R [Porphyromonas macacae]